jgi:hypothetical protein
MPEGSCPNTRPSANRSLTFLRNNNRDRFSAPAITNSSPLPLLRVRLMQTLVMDQDDLAPYTFRCPNLPCGAQYIAIPKDHAPDVEPRCIECDTPLLVKHKRLFLHYQLLRFD